MQLFDAVVLADDPLARTKIAGLAAHERARRVAVRVGARRVIVVASAAERAALTSDASALLVIRANQLVHTPLVAPLVAAFTSGTAISVGSDGVDGGAYVTDRVGDALAAIARGDDSAAFAPDAARVVHGEIARHAIATPAERAAAHRLLYRILIKAQDNVITRYLYRPISFPITRLLVWTPISPNMVSGIVAIMVAIGCWLTVSASFGRAVAGSAIILAASYLDCCDGEIARVKLLSSRFGAWMDTIVDELSSVGYMIALGYHCHLRFGGGYFGSSPADTDPWLLATWISSGLYAACMYFMYYNIIVGVGSANSQDYVGTFEAVPGSQPGSFRLRAKQPAPAVEKKPLPAPIAWIATYAPYIVRRDFISWLAVLLCALHLTHVLFAMFVLGGVITFSVLARDHVAFRRLRSRLLRGGNSIEPITRSA